MIALKRLLLVCLPVALAALGYWAGPTLAQFNPTVRLATIIVAEKPVDARTRSEAEDAFAQYQQTLRQRRDNGQGPVTEDSAREALRAEGLRIEGAFRVGTMLLGAWCGLAAALRVVALSRVPRRREYEIERRLCVSCGRCFMSCPKERLRRKQAAEQVKV